MSAPRLLLGTRGSELARTQSETVAAALRARGFDVELSIIRTAGDRDTTATFGSIGAQGVFVREIEQALVQRRIDLAVHSYKDLPTRSPEELTIAAVPARVDPADVLLVSPAAVDRAAGWLPVRAGARIGTASARRSAWLKHFRPDLNVQPLRGNVPTRVRKLAQGEHDAILLAAAGLARLGADAALTAALSALTIVRLDPERFVPAPAQGALAVQCRRDTPAVLAAVGTLDDAASRAAVTAERAALARAEGGCEVAFGAYCTGSGTNSTLLSMLERGGRVLEARASGAADTLADKVWRALAGGGAA